MDYGINLDAEAVREEISDRAQYGSLDTCLLYTSDAADE